VVEGIIAPESANNGVSGGALIPLLTLGVPGDVTTAVLLGAFLIQGLQAGPMLFTEHPDIVYSIFTGMFVINIVMLVAGLFGQKIFIKIVSMPNFIIVPMIFILCVVGSFAINNSIFDVGVMFCFGLFGYVLNKLEIPEAPVVIGLILGPLVESSLRRALILSKGSMMIFIQKPISAIFLLLSLLSMSWPYFAKLYKARMTQKQ
jgi:putative tricarboxylic transport membrane protein